MDTYILDTFLLVIILMFIIAIINYHYAKYRSIQKKYWSTNNIKTGNNELKKVWIKNHTFYCFEDIIIIEDFEFGKIILDKELSENILIYDVLYKPLISAKPLRIMFDNVDGFIWDYNGTKHLALFNIY